MKMFGMCINKGVVAGVAGVGLLVWVLAPGALVTALPFLLIAICPLSMVVMMKMMTSDGQASSPAQPSPTAPAQPDTAAVAPPARTLETTHPTVTDASTDLDARRN